MRSWDPFHDLVNIQDRMNKLFESVLTGPVALPDGAHAVSRWKPVSEVVETARGVEIDCELPGLDASDVHLEVDGRVLSIVGERSRSLGESQMNFQRLERPFGHFVRKFELPETIDATRIKKQMSNGVLHVVIPTAQDE